MTNPVNGTNSPDPVTLRQARKWFEVIHAGGTPEVEDFRGWQQWLARSPINRRAYEELEHAWNVWEGVRRPPSATLRELAADSGDVDADDRTELDIRARGANAKNTAHLTSAKRHPRHADNAARGGDRSPGWWHSRTVPSARAAALAGLVALVSAGLLVLSLSPDFRGARQSIIQTAAAEHREVALPDGSRALLGAQSLVSVDFTEEARSIVVDRGEVYFDVARERRPFKVRAGTGLITALGTAFNVHYVQGRVLVTVAHGRVEVNDMRPAPKAEGGAVDARAVAPAAEPSASTVRIGAGERASYGLEPLTVHTVNVKHAQAWQSGQLRYIGEPLEFVVADVARYTRTQLLITDPEVAKLRYTGTVLQDGVDEWLDGLRYLFPLEIVRVDGDTVLIRSASSAPTQSLDGGSHTDARTQLPFPLMSVL